MGEIADWYEDIALDVEAHNAALHEMSDNALIVEVYNGVESESDIEEMPEIVKGILHYYLLRQKLSEKQREVLIKYII